jgi:hypothetical protein
MVLAGTTESTPCSTSHGDAFRQNVPLTVVHAAPPTTLRASAGPGASEIHGAIYDLAASSSSGGPIEEFTPPGSGGAYDLWSILPARTNRVVLSVRWSFVVTGGEVTHLFEMRLEPG